MSWIRMAIAGVAFLGAASVATAQAPQGDAHKQGGHEIGVLEPAHFLQSLEKVRAEPCQIVGNDDDGEPFHCVLKDGLTFGRLVYAFEQRQVLRL